MLILIVMAGLYFHIPFCKRICAYCDFYKSARLELLQPVVEAMLRELDARLGELDGEPLRTLYFGGGTPSLCPPETLQRFIDRILERRPDAILEEVTVEANPDDLTPDYLARLSRTRVNRLSIGIQSFDDDCLRMMNRRHTARQALEALHEARRAGFRNLTADLIFGIPGFGEEPLRRSLAQLLEAGVEHVSAYHLTIEPGTAFGRREARGALHAVDEEQSVREFQLVHETLTRAGFEHYEVSNFARPGFRARHNSAYWSGDPYLGIGPAAHSYDGAVRRWNPSSVEGYLAGEEGGSERLSERDRYNEYVMTALRTAEGIDLERLAARFGPHRLESVRRTAERFIRAGELAEQRGRLAIPPERFLVSDDVIEHFFET